MYWEQTLRQGPVCTHWVRQKKVYISGIHPNPWYTGPLESKTGPSDMSATDGWTEVPGIMVVLKIDLGTGEGLV